MFERIRSRALSTFSLVAGVIACSGTYQNAANDAGSDAGIGDDAGGGDDSATTDGGTSDGPSMDAGEGGNMCSWTVLSSCPPEPQAPCVPGSSTGVAACDACLTVTCGATWNCCGSDPTEMSEGSMVYPACFLLTACILQDLQNGDNYGAALAACEGAASYTSQSEAAAEALIACYMAECESACP
jgi:hypothetical protein